MTPVTGKRPGWLGVCPVRTTWFFVPQCSQRQKYVPSRVCSKVCTFESALQPLQMN